MWEILPISAGIAFILGFFFMIFLKLCAGIIVWLSILLILLALGAAGFGCKLKFDDLTLQEAETEVYSDKTKYWEYGMYGFWIGSGVYALVILFLCNRIRLGVAILKCTASFIGRNPSIFIVPVVFLFLILVWVVVWMFFAIFIYTIGEITQRPSPLGFLSDVIWEPETRYMWYYHLFALLWINAFFIGCG